MILTVETAGGVTKPGPPRAAPVRGLVFHLVALPVARVIHGSETQQNKTPLAPRNEGTGKSGSCNGERGWKQNEEYGFQMCWHFFPPGLAMITDAKKILLNLL